MSIGIYRLYLGHAWTHSIARPALLRALDMVPSFFYRLDRISDLDAAETRADETLAKNLVRIAMTQSHVALVDADRGNLVHDLTSVEVALAQSGFRSRIPILAITRRPEQPLDSLVVEHADRVVSFDAGDIVCAIQEMAEEAAAGRRRENERLLNSIHSAVRDHEAVRWPRRLGANQAGKERPIPVTEIATAFAALASRRSQDRAN